MNAPAPLRRDLPISGMTCASCVRRVERALGAVPGVEEASVNLVTEKASVTFHPALASIEDLARAVRDAGYDVPETAPAPAITAIAEAPADPRDQAEDHAQQQLQRDVLFSAALSLPLLVLAMSHGALPGTDGPWVPWAQLALATPVVFGPGRRFFRLGWIAAKHRSPDMNTLVALGTGAAWLYSTIAVLAPGFFDAHAAHGSMPHVYFEAAGAILTFVLLGKWLEGRAKRRLSDAVRSLVALQPKLATRVLPDGEQLTVAIEQVKPGWQLLVRPGERVPADG
ncbi:MAG: cation-translocating P-type ATPase, partial [Myxococcales bacterium]|nr:cation-translocating P-type ATPase [Myxococcales bacterium]